jgi:hypothetical protein
MSSATRDFDRRFFKGENELTRIGGGEIGGKAAGLAGIAGTLSRHFAADRFPGFAVGIPRCTVIGTEHFDAFLAANGMSATALDGLPDDRIAHEFQRGTLPPSLVGDLRALAEEVRAPLAVRSSSALEDAMFRPFAGVYTTKMIPNNQPQPDERFRRLVEAVKLVWASTFFADARRYLATVDRRPEDERMAVLIQEVVGRRAQDRFYPSVAGVARSHNFYPSGGAQASDGVVDLALGLGRTIVEGGTVWSYSPARPTAPLPFNGVADLMRHTQTAFWAVNMGKPPAWNPIRETEHLVQGRLADAELDGSLRFVASTYDPQSDRLVPGIGPDGPRVLDFAPLLDGFDVPLNDVVRALLGACEEALGAKVEIEFAVDLDPRRGVPARLGFLQVRPMVVTAGEVDVPAERLARADVVIASVDALGNGARRDLEDIVYLKPDAFEPKLSAVAAAELARVNAALGAEQRHYLLVGFGRWGTSDPWRGVPVTWAQIGNARAIVEIWRKGMETELSQGSHFFHNVTSFEVLYLSVSEKTADRVDWTWLSEQPLVQETRFVRHVRPARPFEVAVDGRSRRGMVVRHDD